MNYQINSRMRVLSQQTRAIALALVCCFTAVPASAQTFGPFNGRIPLDGAGLKKPIGANAPTKANDEWTMNFWIRPTRALDDETLLAGFGDVRNETGQQRYLASFADGLRFWGASIDVPAKVFIEPNKWQMLSAVYQGGSVKIYKDGVELVSEPIKLNDAVAQVNLGPVSQWPSSKHFSGNIARFTLRNGALSPQAIRALLAESQGLDNLTYETGRPNTWQPQNGGGQNGNPNQNPASFPKSRAPFSVGQKLLTPNPERLAKTDDGGLAIASGWKLVEAPKLKAAGAMLSRPGFDTRSWYDATVPGTVLTTLVNQGVYPDPDYGLNNLAIPESLNKQDYWYRAEFATPREFAKRNATLTFNGINYRAEVWLNGTRLGEIAGAFTRGTFNVGSLLKPNAKNVLAVKVSPVPNPGIPHEASPTAGAGPNGGSMVTDGPTFFCSEGWDWIPGIRDRNTGIWQDVVLKASDAVSFGDAQVVTQLVAPIGSRADVTVSAELKNSATTAQKGVLRGEFEGVAFEKAVTLPARATQTVTVTPKDFYRLAVKNPRLWWPNGYGKPELYHLRLSFRNAQGKVSDIKQVRFGMREISVELSAFDPNGKIGRYEFFPAKAGKTRVIDTRHSGIVNTSRGWMPVIADGAEKSPALLPSNDQSTAPFLIVKVNGQRIPIKGGNWGMDDAMKRVSRERLEPYIRMQRDANFTMIRNWCGQSTEKAFFDLCDEYGILIWNDFWITTQGYNQEPRDAKLFLDNAEDTIKRFRNHPSIALWCGRNEGVPAPVINEGLDNLIREYDGTRTYQPNSIAINLLGSGPWGYDNSANFFNNYKGLTTELGLPSLPTVDAIRAMMAPADVWPISDTWAYHDWHQAGAGDVRKFVSAIGTQFGEATSLEDLDRKSQMLNYIGHRAMFEGLNNSLWKPSTGRLMWMSHSSWPSMAWQLYSSDYQPNAAFYGVRKGCEPVHVQWNMVNNTALVANNTTRPLGTVKIVARIFKLDGTVASSEEKTLDVPANSVVQSFTLRSGGQGIRFIKLELRDANNQLLSENFYWDAPREADYKDLNQLPAVTLAANASLVRDAQKTTVTVNLENPSKSVALMTFLTLRNASNSQRILPAYADENYVSLLPGEKKTITIECSAAASKVPLNVTATGWNIAPLTMQVGE